MRGMLGLEETSSENVARIRETEDGVNRALLMSAAEEIKRLRARELVLEGEAARRRVKGSGFFSFGGGGADGVDTAQMTRLTTELARLEEDNGRQRWMIGEKDKQIKETQAKFAASEGVRAARTTPGVHGGVASRCQLTGGAAAVLGRQRAEEAFEVG